MKAKYLVFISLLAAFSSGVTGLEVRGLASEPIEVSPGGSAGARMVDSAMSEDGRTVFAAQNSTVNYNDRLWRSTDGGVTFGEVLTASAGRWFNVDVTADGQTVYASFTNDSVNYSIVKSTDGGANWGTIVTTGVPICDLSVSDSGAKVVWVQCGTGFFFSDDGAQTWSMNAFPAPGVMNRVDLAGDGSKVVGVSGSSVYYADNPTTLSTTWSTTSLGSTSVATSVNVSEDGDRVLVGTQSASDGDAWISEDGGATFSAAGLSSVYGSSSQAVFTAMSGDGMTMIWAFYGSGLWISRDGGDQFAETPITIGWLSFALNGDGMRGLMSAENQYPRVLRRQRPSVSNVLPDSGSAPNVTVLTVEGVNFFDGCDVYVDGIARPTTFVSASTLTATLPSAQTAATVTVLCDDLTQEWYWIYTVNTTTTHVPRTTTTTEVASTLPPTGSRSSGATGMALLMVLLGGGLVVLYSRVRSAQSSR